MFCPKAKAGPPLAPVLLPPNALGVAGAVWAGPPKGEAPPAPKLKLAGWLADDKAAAPKAKGAGLLPDWELCSPDPPKAGAVVALAPN